MEDKIDKIFKDKTESIKRSKFLIALSGGVDSSYVAFLVKKFGLRAFQDGTVEAAAARGLPIIDLEI